MLNATDLGTLASKWQQRIDPPVASMQIPSAKVVRSASRTPTRIVVQICFEFWELSLSAPTQLPQLKHKDSFGDDEVAASEPWRGIVIAEPNVVKTNSLWRVW